MDRALYVAMTGAAQTLKAQTVNSHNLANASTVGFKAERADTAIELVDHVREWRARVEGRLLILGRGARAEHLRGTRLIETRVNPGGADRLEPR